MAEFGHPVGFAAQFLRERGIDRLRFDEAQRLLSRGGELLDATARVQLSPARRVLVFQTTRATHTYEAVNALCAIGRGVQASMLNRSLLEDALDVHWVAENPESAPDLAQQHDDAIALARRSLAHKFEGAAPLTPTEERELATHSTTYQGFQRTWTLAKMSDRIAAVKRRWGASAANELDIVYQLHQRENNLLLHASPAAYRETAMPRPGGDWIPNRIGPDRRWVEALGRGGLAYYFTVRVLAEEFGLDKEPAGRSFERLSYYTKQFSDAELDPLPATAACPCGIGQTVAGCHRS